MASVRAELGPDAVVLSSKKIGDQFEMVAAVDFDVDDLSSNLDGNVELSIEQQVEQQRQLSSQPSVAKMPDEQVLNELHQELAALRQQLLLELSKISGAKAAPAERLTGLHTQLEQLGLSKGFSDALIREMGIIGQTKEGWNKALRLLVHKLNAGEDEILSKGGIFAMLGSTGVGKTTTVAKLAARFVMREGRNQIGLITTDCYRVGGQEQLESFARYLRIPVKVATTEEEIKQALKSFEDKKLVLIDTAGMGQRDVRLFEQYAALAGSGYHVRPYLVLSATSSRAVMNEVVNVFGSDVIAGTVVTKLDEATSLGSVMDVLISQHLTVDYFSTGQKVPEDLILGRPDALVLQAVELAKSAVEEPSAIYDQLRKQIS